MMVEQEMTKEEMVRIISSEASRLWGEMIRDDSESDESSFQPLIIAARWGAIDSLCKELGIFYDLPMCFL